MRPTSALGQAVDEEEGTRPHDGEVADHWHKHPEHFTDVVENAIGLLGENQDDAAKKSVVSG